MGLFYQEVSIVEKRQDHYAVILTENIAPIAGGWYRATFPTGIGALGMSLMASALAGAGGGGGVKTTGTWVSGDTVLSGIDIALASRSHHSMDGSAFWTSQIAVVSGEAYSLSGALRFTVPAAPAGTTLFHAQVRIWTSGYQNVSTVDLFDVGVGTYEYEVPVYASAVSPPNGILTDFGNPEATDGSAYPSGQQLVYCTSMYLAFHGQLELSYYYTADSPCDRITATSITSTAAILSSPDYPGAVWTWGAKDNPVGADSTDGILHGLTGDTWYWYKLKLNCLDTIVWFKTLPEGTLYIETLPATDLDWENKSATLNGASAGMEQVYFEFDITPVMAQKSVIIPATDYFSVYMHHAYQNRTYYFRAVGIDSHGTKYYGATMMFELVQTTAADAYVTKLIIRGSPLVPLETMTLTASDAASIAKYGRRTYNLSTQYSLNQDDTQVILNEILADNKDPRVNNLIITFQNLKAGAYKDSVIAADISTRITLINTLLGLDGDFFINNVKHTVIEGGTSYTVQWRLERIYDTTPEP